MDDVQFSHFVADRYMGSNEYPLTIPSPVLLGGTAEIKLERLPPEQIEKLLWMHPVVPRGIEIKANRMIRRGYTITPHDSTPTATDAANEMIRLLENSGGIIRLKKWIQDAYGFGDGYMTLVPNEDRTRIVRINPEHPVFFRVAKNPKKREFAKESIDKGELEPNYEGEYKIDPRTKLPISYTQVKFSPLTKTKFVPIQPEIPADRVAHLVFDTWGDEVIGISVIQTLHLAIKYLLNIEEAGAESLYRNGFVQKKVTTDIINEKDLNKLAKNLRGINQRDAIILPRGTDVQNLNPGTSDFPKFHEVFVTLLAVRLGIPKPLLLLDGTQTNKATLDSQIYDMAADFQADEKIIENAIENQIFVPALRLLYGDGFNQFPDFKFNEVPEGKDLIADRLVKVSGVIEALSRSAVNLISLNRQEEANRLYDLIGETLRRDLF